jgi:hypothetical protein
MRLTFAAMVYSGLKVRSSPTDWHPQVQAPWSGFTDCFSGGLNLQEESAQMQFYNMLFQAGNLFLPSLDF